MQNDRAEGRNNYKIIAEGFNILLSTMKLYRRSKENRGLEQHYKPTKHNQTYTEPFTQQQHNMHSLQIHVEFL